MSPPPLVVEHRCRASALEKETLWRLEGDTLLKVVEGQPPCPLPLDFVTGVRLQFAPTRYQEKRFLCHLSDTRGRQIKIQSGHYLDFAEFEDRGETYRELLLALIRRRAALGPGCRYLAGISYANWILQSAVLVGALAILAPVFLLYGSSASDWTWERLLLILGALPAAWFWLSLNRPRHFDPAAVPGELLPTRETAPSGKP